MIQRYTLYRGSLEPTTNGGWVKYEDAKELEKALVNLLGDIIAEITNPHHSPLTKIDNITFIAREAMGVKG